MRPIYFCLQWSAIQNIIQIRNFGTIPAMEYRSIVLDAFLTECVARDCAFSTERCIPNGMLIFVRRLFINYSR